MDPVEGTRSRTFSAIAAWCDLLARAGTAEDTARWQACGQGATAARSWLWLGAWWKNRGDFVFWGPHGPYGAEGWLRRVRGVFCALFLAADNVRLLSQLLWFWPPEMEKHLNRLRRARVW
eukprot:Hpha_TRINITY_DN24331_c0_g1::TRINITY_DN24331_c0_g1_i1::g.147951::m.147951